MKSNQLISIFVASVKNGENKIKVKIRNSGLGGDLDC